MKHFCLFSLLIISLLSLSVQATAQQKVTSWVDICNNVKTYYHTSDNEKRQAVSFLLENAPYHFTKVNDTLTSYYEQLARINQEFKYPQCKSKMGELYSKFNGSMLICVGNM